MNMHSFLRSISVRIFFVYEQFFAGCDGFFNIPAALSLFGTCRVKYNGVTETGDPAGKEDEPGRRFADGTSRPITVRGNRHPGHHSDGGIRASLYRAGACRKNKGGANIDH